MMVKEINQQFLLSFQFGCVTTGNTYNRYQQFVRTNNHKIIGNIFKLSAIFLLIIFLKIVKTHHHGKHHQKVLGFLVK